MTSVLIREAREIELDETVRLLRTVFGSLRPGADARLLGSRRVDPAYLAAFERYFTEIVNVRSRIAESQLFVAVEAARIVGTGTLYPPGRAREYVRAFPSGKPWPDAWAGLRLLAVDPAHRGRGIGRMLLEARVKRARELGAPVVALHTSREFAEGRRLVQEMGFERSPEFDYAPAPGACAEAYALPLD